MKRTIPAFIALLLFCATGFAQITANPLRKLMTLSMPGETGSNGASVLWHPVLKKYYASFAGNSSYPFAVFDATGKLISPDDLEAMFDVRGIWYNTVSKKIEANGYNEAGWVSYTLDTKGIPSGTVTLQEGQVQPDPQSVGVFDAIKKRICFLNEGNIYSYSLAGEASDEVIELKNLQPKKDQPEGELEDNSNSSTDYNATALCYTGIINAEFAIINNGAMQIELYSRKGILTRAFKLPADIPVYPNFNFAYANGFWWLFDKEARTWSGYK